MNPDTPRPQGRNSFIALMVFFGIVFAAVLIFQYLALLQRQNSVVGDGARLASYRYDLSALRVDVETLIPVAGMHKDAQPALGELTVLNREETDRLREPGPKAVTADAVEEVNDGPPGDWRKLIVGPEEVIGVVIEGEARAYPIRFMRWHEIVNDTLGGKPIAVTYSPLCDSSAVFDRRVGGEILAFGYSGLVHDSNLVMYDKRPGGGGADADLAKGGGGTAESLWSQLQFRAIAGPAAEAERELAVLPMWVGTWERWVEEHPDTTVFAGDATYRDRYKRNPLGDYFRKGELRYPAAPLPPTDSRRQLMDKVTAYRTGDGWRIEVSPADETWEMSAVPEGTPIVTARYFAWYAMHGGGGASEP